MLPKERNARAWSRSKPRSCRGSLPSSKRPAARSPSSSSRVLASLARTQHARPYGRRQGQQERAEDDGTTEQDARRRDLAQQQEREEDGPDRLEVGDQAGQLGGDEAQPLHEESVGERGTEQPQHQPDQYDP